MSILKGNRHLLYSLYVENEQSLSRIAADYNVSASTVRAWLKSVGIQTRESTQTIYRELKETDFSPLQKNLLAGSLLGDGSLRMGNDCVNASFNERHCESQHDYLSWKNGILKPFVKSKLAKTEACDHIIVGTECRCQSSYKLTTISHPYLTALYYKWYRDGKKVVPMDVFGELNVLSYAVWFCDDGSLVYRPKDGVYRLDLHTEGFTHKENVFLCRGVLSKFFDMPFRLNERTYKSGKAWYICISGQDNLRRITDVLKPVIPDCMLHKFKHYL